MFMGKCSNAGRGRASPSHHRRAGTQTPPLHPSQHLQVVETRLNVCAALQPKNPAVYKLRADLLQRFGAKADRDKLVADFKKAIKLAEADKEGVNLLKIEGVEPKEQRDFLLAYCHHQLGSLLHRAKDIEGAFEHYGKAIEHAGELPCTACDRHWCHR